MAVSDALTRAEQCLLDLTVPAELVRRSLDELSVEELDALHLPYVALNLRALLAGRYAEPVLIRLSVENLKYVLYQGWVYRAWLAGAPDDRQRLFPLDDDDFAAIAEICPSGRSAVVCSFHLGQYRFLVHAFAALGHRVLATMDSRTYAELNPGLLAAQARCSSSAYVSDKRIAEVANLTFCTVEDSAATLRMCRHVKNGGVLFIFLDGNTGLDGVHGVTSKRQISFGGYRLGVKTGALRLAEATRAPLYLSMMQPTTAGSSRPVTWQVIPPNGARTPGSEAADPVQTMWQKLYECMQGNETCWESLRFCHRWRTQGDNVNSGETAGTDQASFTPDSNCESVLLSPYMQRVTFSTGYAWINALTLLGVSGNSPGARVLDQLRVSSPLEISAIARNVDMPFAMAKELCAGLLSAHHLIPAERARIFA